MSDEGSMFVVGKAVLHLPHDKEVTVTLNQTDPAAQRAAGERVYRHLTVCTMREGYEDPERDIADILAYGDSRYRAGLARGKDVITSIVMEHRHQTVTPVFQQQSDVLLMKALTELDRLASEGKG